MKLQRLLISLSLLALCTCAGAQTEESGAAASKSEVDGLVLLLDDKDPTTRGVVARELISFQDPYGVSAVRKALETGSANARIALAAAIKVARDERFISELVPLLEAEEEEVAKAAMSAFTSFESAQRLQPVKGLLLDPTRPILARARAAKLLGGETGKEAVEALIEVLDDNQQELERVAYDSLRKITLLSIPNDRTAWLKWWAENKYKSRSEWLADVIKGLKKALAKVETELELHKKELTNLHKDLLKAVNPNQDLKPFIAASKRSDLPKLQVYAIDALTKINDDAKPVADVFIELLSPEQAPEVVAAACAALGKVGDDSAKDALLGQLSSDHATVKESAARALGKEVFNVPEVTARLSALLDDPAKGVRAGACWSLGKLKAEGVSAKLLELLQKDPAGAVRAEAVTALAEIGNVDVVSAVADKLLNDQHELVRYRATEALGKLGPLPELKDKSVAVNSLCQALTKPESDDGVRRACAIALGQIGDPGAIATLKQALDDSYSEVVTKAWDALLAIIRKEPALLAGPAQDMAALLKTLAQSAQEQFERALEAYRLLLKEIASKPEHERLVAEANLRLSRALVQLDQLSDALVIYQELVLEQPDLWQEVVELLQSMNTNKQYKEVVDAIGALRSKDPDLGGEKISKQLDVLEAQCKQALQSSGATAPAPSEPSTP